jgi:hypothetical protein
MSLILEVLSLLGLTAIVALGGLALAVLLLWLLGYDGWWREP